MKINSYIDIRPEPDLIPRPPVPETKSLVPKNPLQDSMEEVAMKFSESVERHSKGLDERHVRESTSSQRVERVEKLAELYRLLDNADSPAWNNRPGVCRVSCSSRVRSRMCLPRLAATRRGLTCCCNRWCACPPPKARKTLTIRPWR